MLDSFYNDSQNESTEIDDLLTDVSDVLKPTDDNVPEVLETIEETPIDNKRNNRLSKTGAKGIVKALDLGAANLARKIALADSATPYRADPEALEDLTEVVKEILPQKAGQALAIPIWLQLLLFTLIAFLPVIITAISDRKQNRTEKEEAAEIAHLKRERKIMKSQLKNKQLAEKLNEADNKKESENIDAN